MALVNGEILHSTAHARSRKRVNQFVKITYGPKEYVAVIESMYRVVKRVPVDEDCAVLRGAIVNNYRWQPPVVDDDYGKMHFVKHFQGQQGGRSCYVDEKTVVLLSMIDCKLARAAGKQNERWQDVYFLEYSFKSGRL